MPDVTSASAPDPATDPVGALTQQAESAKAVLLQQVHQQLSRAMSASQSLSRQAGQLQESITHTYGVFQVSPAPRFMVLRDVAELNGTAPKLTAASFVEALQWVNQRVLDVVATDAPQPSAVSPQRPDDAASAASS